jgi:hypothetical protein
MVTQEFYSLSFVILEISITLIQPICMKIGSIQIEQTI